MYISSLRRQSSDALCAPSELSLLLTSAMATAGVEADVGKYIVLTLRPIGSTSTVVGDIVIYGYIS